MKCLLVVSVYPNWIMRPIQYFTNFQELWLNGSPMFPFNYSRFAREERQQIANRLLDTLAQTLDSNVEVHVHPDTEHIVPPKPQHPKVVATPLSRETTFALEATNFMDSVTTTVTATADMEPKPVSTLQKVRTASALLHMIATLARSSWKVQQMFDRGQANRNGLQFLVSRTNILPPFCWDLPPSRKCGAIGGVNWIFTCFIFLWCPHSYMWYGPDQQQQQLLILWGIFHLLFTVAFPFCLKNSSLLLKAFNKSSKAKRCSSWYTYRSLQHACSLFVLCCLIIWPKVIRLSIPSKTDMHLEATTRMSLNYLLQVCVIGQWGLVIRWTFNFARFSSLLRPKDSNTGKEQGKTRKMRKKTKWVHSRRKTISDYPGWRFCRSRQVYHVGPTYWLLVGLLGSSRFVHVCVLKFNELYGPSHASVHTSVLSRSLSSHVDCDTCFWTHRRWISCTSAWICLGTFVMSQVAAESQQSIISFPIPGDGGVWYRKSNVNSISGLHPIAVH